VLRERDDWELCDRRFRGVRAATPSARMSLCIVLSCQRWHLIKHQDSPAGIKDKEIDLAADGFLVANNQP
jgi:hypothetical protein